MPSVTTASYNLGNSRQSNRINSFQRKNPIIINKGIASQVGIFCSDLDGTLVKGDITEGGYFKGMTEHLYDLGLSKTDKYPTYNDYATEYFRRWDKYDIGALEMPYDVYDDTKDTETKQAISDYWESTIQNYFVTDTKNLLQAKADAGNKLWIVSGSPRMYIEPITKYLPFIEKIIAAESNTSSYTITYGPGKITRIKQANNNSLSGIVGYVGDTWKNDGPPMSAIKNYNSFADVIFVDHFESLSYDTIQNLKIYNMKRMKTLVS